MNTLESISLLLIEASYKHQCMLHLETLIDTISDSDIECLEVFIQQRLYEGQSLFFYYRKPFLSIRIEPKISNDG
jgi:hypothetical protein